MADEQPAAAAPLSAAEIAADCRREGAVIRSAHHRRQSARVYHTWHEFDLWHARPLPGPEYEWLMKQLWQEDWQAIQQGHSPCCDEAHSWRGREGWQGRRCHVSDDQPTMTMRRHATQRNDQE